jgi:hypothetical protein
MQKLLHQLEQYLPEGAKKNTAISAAAINWHIDHSLKVINSVSKNIMQSDPALYQKEFNWRRTFVFIKGGIPRGVGKAPKTVTPPDIIMESDLLEQISAAKKWTDALNSLQPNQNFKHPLFGMLNAKQTVKFLKMHTRHHIKIIQDIIRHA